MSGADIFSRGHARWDALDYRLPDRLDCTPTKSNASEDAWPADSRKWHLQVRGRDVAKWHIFAGSINSHSNHNWCGRLASSISAQLAVAGISISRCCSTVFPAAPGGAGLAFPTTTPRNVVFVLSAGYYAPNYAVTTGRDMSLSAQSRLTEVTKRLYLL